MRTSLMYKRVVLLYVAILALSFPCCPSSSLAEASNDNSFASPRYTTPRYILHVGSNDRSLLSNAPIAKNVTEQTARILDDLYSELTRIFHTTPSTQIIVRFLDPQEFRKQTGAPAWTSAMFLRGEITIPIAPNKSFNLDELTRTLRHEYAHAIVGELSSYRCPAWFDEGIAQLIEGEANPLIGPALLKWIERDDAMPLSWLVHGFTTLDRSIVPAAYGQSLFAVRSLINRHGFSNVLSYLNLLKTGQSHETAFETTFKSTTKEFEAGLTEQMRTWARALQPRL